MIYEFPKWADIGKHVKYKDMEWVITETYITGNYAGDWGVLLLSSAFIPGVEMEVDAHEVTPV